MCGREGKEWTDKRREKKRRMTSLCFEKELYLCLPVCETIGKGRDGSDFFSEDVTYCTRTRTSCAGYGRERGSTERVQTFTFHFLFFSCHSGPVPLPMIGNLASLNPMGPSLTLMSKKYGGMFPCWFGKSLKWIVSDPEYVSPLLERMSLCCCLVRLSSFRYHPFGWHLLYPFFSSELSRAKRSERRQRGGREQTKEGDEKTVVCARVRVKDLSCECLIQLNRRDSTRVGDHLGS